MRKQLTDEQTDLVIKAMLRSAAADEGTIEEAAASPAVWWNIQRHIGENAAESKHPWPPIVKWWRLALAGIPLASAAVILAYVAFVPEQRKDVPDVSINSVQTIPSKDPLDNDSVAGEPIPETATSKPLPTASTRQHRKAVKSIKRTSPKRQAPFKETESQIRSDFIALSYARDPESGQVVRIKVPSTMMVTLGLLSSVERQDDTVDAEIIVGDDGLTRAIRFIRQ